MNKKKSYSKWGLLMAMAVGSSLQAGTLTVGADLSHSKHHMKLSGDVDLSYIQDPVSGLPDPTNAGDLVASNGALHRYTQASPLVESKKFGETGVRVALDYLCDNNWNMGVSSTFSKLHGTGAEEYSLNPSFTRPDGTTYTPAQTLFTNLWMLYQTSKQSTRNMGSSSKHKAYLGYQLNLTEKFSFTPKVQIDFENRSICLGKFTGQYGVLEAAIDQGKSSTKVQRFRSLHGSLEGLFSFNLTHHLTANLIVGYSYGQVKKGAAQNLYVNYPNFRGTYRGDGFKIGGAVDLKLSEKTRISFEANYTDHKYNCKKSTVDVNRILTSTFPPLACTYQTRSYSQGKTSLRWKTSSFIVGLNYKF